MDGARIARRRLVGPDPRAPRGDLAGAVEHVFVGERHAGEGAELLPLGQSRIDGLGHRQSILVLEGDHCIGQLVDGLQPLDRLGGGLHARDPTIADSGRQIDTGHFFKIDKLGHGSILLGFQRANEIGGIRLERQPSRNRQRRLRKLGNEGENDAEARLGNVVPFEAVRHLVVIFRL